MRAPDGACTPELLTTKLEQYAGRLLDNENAAIKARAAAAAVTTAPAIATPVAPSIPPSSVEQGRRKRILGWSLIGAGALAGAGASRSGPTTEATFSAARSQAQLPRGTPHEDRRDRHRLRGARGGNRWCSPSVD